MKALVTEIAPDVFRISAFHPDFGIQFNQFLVRDDEPFLMHTGMRRMFDTTREAVATLIEPARLRWIGYGHFEPDECGALNEWLEVAPDAQAVCSTVGANVMLSDFANRPPRALADGEGLEIGRRRLRFLSTPHFPHGWDAGLFFEETARTLFCSDLFFQPGDPPALADGDLVGPASEAMRSGATGPLARDFAWTSDTEPTLGRLAALAPSTLAVMHGSSFRGDAARAIREITPVLREVYARPA